MEREQENQPVTITEALMNVFHYAFIESAPYSFFIPTRDKYVAVNLTKKIYHCLNCGKELTVNYNRNGVVYFSKARFEQQRGLYAKRELPFPDKHDLRAEKEFVYHAEGYCTDCAFTSLEGEGEAQELYGLCLALHQSDEAVLKNASLAMREIVESWVKQITDSSQLTSYDLSSYTALKDLVCAVILRDLSSLQVCLTDYRRSIDEKIAAITAKLEDIPDKWQCYVAMPTAIYESMSDELYHEYTVAFPVKETVAGEFYVKKSLEKTRVAMFIAQKRIDHMEELIMEAGFRDEWVDLFIDHVTSLKK